MRTDVRNSNETLRAHRGEHKRGSARRMAPCADYLLSRVTPTLAQLRQKKVAHFVAGGAGRMRRHVDRADCLPGAVEHRHRDRAQATLELLVHNGKALLVIKTHAIEQRL